MNNYFERSCEAYHICSGISDELKAGGRRHFALRIFLVNPETTMWVSAESAGQSDRVNYYLECI